MNSKLDFLRIHLKATSLSRLLSVNGPQHKYFLNSSLCFETFFILDPFFIRSINMTGRINKEENNMKSNIMFCRLLLTRVD